MIHLIIGNRQLNNSAKIETYWGDYESNAYVLAGEPELTITKTPHQPLYQVGDDVYFDVFIENTGTLPVTNWWMNEGWPTNYDFMWINDWFDSSGLEFVEVIPNAYPQNYISAGPSELHFCWSESNRQSSYNDSICYTRYVATWLLYELHNPFQSSKRRTI